jgi:hypothetical protein
MPVNVDTLNCVYFALFFLGVGYAIFVVITGGLSHIDIPNIDIDVPQVDVPGHVEIPAGGGVHVSGPELPSAGLDTPDVTVSPLSPITIATFVTVFGGIGVLSTQLFVVDPRLSLVFATVGGLACAGIMFVLYSQILIRSQASSEIHQGEIVGLQAEVAVPIGETAAGQVTYLTRSGRMSSMARSVDGRAIPRGQFVTIVRVIGSQVLVELVRSGPGNDE